MNGRERVEIERCCSFLAAGMGDEGDKASDKVGHGSVLVVCVCLGL
jgi:hypothetical protein